MTIRRTESDTRGLRPRSSAKRLAVALVGVAFLAGGLTRPAAAIPSTVEHRGSGVALDGYDRDQVLEVDGKPFFYNGIQYRIDKNKVMFGHDYDDIDRLMHEIKNLGYSVVNAQILWKDIQPDTTVNATESAYIADGENAASNFAGRLKTSYEPGNPSNQSLALVKFQIPDDYDLSVDGAKIRIRTATPMSSSQGLNVYAIDNDWHQDGVTWSGAGFTVDGMGVSRHGERLAPVGVLPAWDQIGAAYVYDLDVTKYVAEAYARGERTLSFVLQDSTPGARATDIVAAANAGGPQLTLSSKNSWDFAHLDRVVQSARNAGLKFEIIWFGADSTGATQDDRAPHYAFVNYEKALRPDGRPIFAKVNDPRYGAYRYLLDKADKNLQAQESHVLATVFDHLATTDLDHTVVGLQTTNEPSTGQGADYSRSASSTARYSAERAAAVAAGTYVDEPTFAAWYRARLQWEYNNAIAEAVKATNHPVWTRFNQPAATDSAGAVAYNEEQRLAGNASLDFIGIDPYQNGTEAVYRIGHAAFYDTTRDKDLPSYAQGENLAMSMENGAAYPNMAELSIATLAGGAFNNAYDICGADAESLLNDSVASELDGKCTAEGSHPGGTANRMTFGPYVYADKVARVTNVNKTLLKVGYDLATKQSDGAGGTQLLFFNATHGSDNSAITDGTQITKSLGSVDVSYAVDGADNAGLAIQRSANEFALVNLGTKATSYKLSGLAGRIASARSGSYDRFETSATENEWIPDKDHSGVSVGQSARDALVTVPPYSAVRVLTKGPSPAANAYTFEAEGQRYSGVTSGPFALSTRDDKIYRDGAHGGYWLKFDAVDIGDTYTFTITVPKGVTRARIETAFRGATSGRGTVQLSVNGTRYGDPINQIRPEAGWYTAAPDQVIRLKPGQKNTFTYTTTAGSNSSLSFDYIRIRRVS